MSLRTRMSRSGSDENLLPDFKGINSEVNSVSSSRKKVFVCIFVAVLLILIVVAIVVTHFARARPKSNRGLPVPVVDTDCGKIEGKFESTGSSHAFVFKGIPYARPPTENLRWKVPQRLKPKKGSCWSQQGSLKAFKFGNICAQPDMFDFSKLSGSEDCLYLNVWTPSLSKSEKLPVMVWIHGGSLVIMSGNMEGIELAQSMRIVLVSINYRLNAFGFMALDALSQSSKSKTSGNYGFMDQTMALKWVQMNIANFGGDPNMITVAGQSSGGTSILGLLASKRARALFKNAIVMSGSPVFTKTTADASKDNQVFLRNSKCNKTTTEDTVKCMYSLSQAQILKSIPWFTYPAWSGSESFKFITKDKFFGPLCVVDGDVVSIAPGMLHAVPALGHNVPVLIGSTAQEIDSIDAIEIQQNKTWAAFTKFLENRLGAFSKDLPKEAINVYEQIFKIKDTKLYYTTMTTDVRVTCPLNTLAKNLSLSSNLNVYRYDVTNRPSKKISTYGNNTSTYSFHGWDMAALFGFHGFTPSFKPAAQDLLFMKEIREEFLHFMKNGKPATNQWKMFPEKVGIFENEGLAIKESYHEEQCNVWDKYNLFPYGWMN